MRILSPLKYSPYEFPGAASKGWDSRCLNFSFFGESLTLTLESEFEGSPQMPRKWSVGRLSFYKPSTYALQRLEDKEESMLIEVSPSSGLHIKRCVRSYQRFIGEDIKQSFKNFLPRTLKSTPVYFGEGVVSDKSVYFKLQFYDNDYSFVLGYNWETKKFLFRYNDYSGKPRNEDSREPFSLYLAQTSLRIAQIIA